MAGRSRISIAKPRIEAHLDAAEARVYTPAALGRVFAMQRELWGLPASMRTAEFVNYLLERSRLTAHQFVPTNEAYERRQVRYFWDSPSPSPPEVGTSLGRAGAYVSHGSAVFVHGLNDQLPKSIYVNSEQSAKPRGSGKLAQDAVNRAFASNSKQRRSQLVYVDESDDSYRYVMLSGKNTGSAGVGPHRDPYGRDVLAAGVERTLIDIAVRPAYAGGLSHVVQAYERASEVASMGKIVSFLKTIDYVYPYHQSIGYLAERAGFRSSQLDRLRKLGFGVDFYLDYGMSDPVYVAEWRLYVPRDL